MDMRTGREVDLVCHRIDFLDNCVGAKLFEVQLIRRSGSLDMSSKEPDQITRLILWRLEDFLVIESSIIRLGCQDAFCELFMDLL